MPRRIFQPMRQGGSTMKVNWFGERRSAKRRTWIVALALLLSVATGGWWASLSSPATTPQAGACHVFAGRSGYVPCSQNYQDSQDKAARKFVGTTGTGCVLGLIFGGPGGVVAGCASGAAGNIPW